MRHRLSDASIVRPPSPRRAHGGGGLASDPVRDSADLPLLTSKLAVPAVPDTLVDRPRLSELLDSGVGGPVTLLSAPAGWGKTALLSAWVRTGVPVHPVGWLTLERDDVGERFWSYVHAALTAALEPVGTREPVAGHEAAGGRTDGRGRSPAPAAWGMTRDGGFLGRLAAALTRLTEPVVLVLDDFDQVRDADVPRGLEFLVRHAAARLRLVIATRVDPALPLPRWRLNGELTELRVPDLAFLRSETAELLARHDLLMTDADLRVLHARTEGWAAALRLAALSLRGHPEPRRFVAEFGGDDRGVADYLAGEVLDAQPAEAQEVLLCTSVLQRVCGPLADALTGRTDGERIVTDLARAGLLVPLPGRRSWYGCRGLLREALGAELRRRVPERIAVLHHRAASWHVATGRPADALGHALAAGDWNLAKSLVTAHWHRVLLSGDQDPPQAPAEPEPPPAEALAADPELALAWAAERLNAGDREGAATCLRPAAAAGQQPAAGHGDRFEVILTAFRLAEARLAGDVTAVLGCAAQLLGLLAPTGPGEEACGSGDEGARAMALSALGTARLETGDLGGAEDALTCGLAAAERAGVSCPRMACAGRLALLWAVRGELTHAENAAQAALGIPYGDCRCPDAHGADSYLAQAIVRYQRGRLDEAQRHLELAARSCGTLCEPLLTALIAIVRTGVLQAQGNSAQGFEVLLSGRRDLGDRQPSPYLQHWFAAAEADLRTSYGDTATARGLIRQAAGTSATLAVALARTYLRDGDPNAAVRALPGWADDDACGSLLSARLDAGLVEAQAARRAGDVRRASGVLERVLELAAPEGFRRVFVQGGQQVRVLLAEHLDSGTAYWSTVYDLVCAFDHRPHEVPPPGPAANRPLTDRELTVLRYLQSMLSNVEIASELCLSVNTVKTHVRNIYRKLDTDRRREAVRKARKLQLL